MRTDAEPPAPVRRRPLRRVLVATGVLAAVPLAVIGWALVIDGRGTRGLEHVVRDVCVPMQRRTGHPFPCLEVSLEGGWAVVGAPLDRSQFLVVPLAPITGLEDPAMLEPSAPRLWPVAWRERGRVGAVAGRPIGDAAIVLAVNSLSARTQWHYHIHVDCLAAPIRRFVAATLPSLGSDWREVRPAPWTALYRMRRIDLAALAGEGADRIVAREIAPSAEAIVDLSIAVIGTGEGPPDDPVLVLATTFGPTPDEGGHAEELMDHRCREE